MHDKTWPTLLAGFCHQKDQARHDFLKFLAEGTPQLPEFPLAWACEFRFS
eukprot:COSAG01_NODE_278_length_19550_cov_53.882217_1_plen_49_part_10